MPPHTRLLVLHGPGNTKHVHRSTGSEDPTGATVDMHVEMEKNLDTAVAGRLDTAAKEMRAQLDEKIGEKFDEATEEMAEDRKAYAVNGKRQSGDGIRTLAEQIRVDPDTFFGTSKREWRDFKEDCEALLKQIQGRLSAVSTEGPTVSAEGPAALAEGPATCSRSFYFSPPTGNGDKDQQPSPGSAVRPTRLKQHEPCHRTPDCWHYTDPATRSMSTVAQGPKTQPVLRWTC